MGAGKSTVAPLLARELSMPVLNIDQEILETSGCKSINEVFTEHGEEFFRRMEAQALEELTTLDKLGVACGGGVVDTKDNQKLLKANGGRVVFLSATFSTITERIGKAQDRPLFHDLDKAAALFRTRLPLYESWADCKIETDGLNPDEVVERIKKSL